MLLSVMGMLAACVGSSSSDSKAPGSKPLDEVAPWWADGAAIKVVEAGRTYVRLRWTAAVDDVAVVKYPIAGDVLGDHYSTSASALISGLAPGHCYAFEVWAQDAAGNATPYPLTVRASTSEGCTATRSVVPARITR